MPVFARMCQLAQCKRCTGWEVLLTGKVFEFEVLVQLAQLYYMKFGVKKL